MLILSYDWSLTVCPRPGHGDLRVQLRGPAAVLAAVAGHEAGVPEQADRQHQLGLRGRAGPG